MKLTREDLRVGMCVSYTSDYSIRGYCVLGKSIKDSDRIHVTLYGFHGIKEAHSSIWGIDLLVADLVSGNLLLTILPIGYLKPIRR